MSWKNSKNFIIFSLLLYFVTLISVTIIAFSIKPLFSNLPANDLLRNSRITDIIALITVITIAHGFLIHFGFILASIKEYRLKIVDFSSKEFITLCGSLILLSIALSVLYLISKQSYVAFVPIIYMLLLIFMGYVLGYDKSLPQINKKVTLKMIVKDASGNTRLRMKHNLDLYQATDKDYRFKDSKTGNEFIIPIGQVQEIIYENRSNNMVKLKKEEEEVLYYIYREKYTANYKPFRLSDIIFTYADKYNRENIVDIINSLVAYGFIVVKTNHIPHPNASEILGFLKSKPNIIEITERSLNIELCSPVVNKITEIKNLLRYRRGINWLKENTVLIWQFLWKHFIVDIIVSALTAYIIIKYINSP